jgi:hypothetical protein
LRSYGAVTLLYCTIVKQDGAGVISRAVIDCGCEITEAPVTGRRNDRRRNAVVRLGNVGVDFSIA